jgi:hypothetical protein
MADCVIPILVGSSSQHHTKEGATEVPNHGQATLPGFFDARFVTASVAAGDTAAAAISPMATAKASRIALHGRVIHNHRGHNCTGGEPTTIMRLPVRRFCRCMFNLHRLVIHQHGSKYHD